MDYAQESFLTFMDECEAIIKDHWKHIALDQDSTPLEPDWEKYIAMTELGIVHLTTARTEDGTLAGYAIYLISNALHYKSLEVAEADVFWLGFEHRKGMTGIKMLKCAERDLRKIGVKKIFNKVKLHADVGKIFEFMGYTAVERVYAKGLT
tara:strand:+ start:303 stop:755 length:453 start_codon:yes stop_codon:yes gene_type:complete